MAKIASDINKPNGQKTIKPKEVIPFLERLPIYKFFGVGKATAKRMNSWGIYNGYQLKQHSLEFLIQNFGKSGTHFYNIVRGIQNSPVRPNRERKSVGAERTYPDNLKSDKEILEKARWICEEIQKRLLSIGTKGRTITLKIKFSDFQQQTRSKTLNEAIDDEDQIYEIVKELVDQEEIKKSVRLVGVSLSNLENEQRQEEETITKKDSQLKLEF